MKNLIKKFFLILFIYHFRFNARISVKFKSTWNIILTLRNLIDYLLISCDWTFIYGIIYIQWKTLFSLILSIVNIVKLIISTPRFLNRLWILANWPISHKICIICSIIVFIDIFSCICINNIIATGKIIDCATSLKNFLIVRGDTIFIILNR